MNNVHTITHGPLTLALVYNNRGMETLHKNNNETEMTFLFWKVILKLKHISVYAALQRGRAGAGRQSVHACLCAKERP